MRVRGDDHASLKATAGAVMLFGDGVTRSGALDCLVIASFIRGPSTRDVEAALGDAVGVEGNVSKSEVSRIGQAIVKELKAWNRPRLDDPPLNYLFLDSSDFATT